MLPLQLQESLQAEHALTVEGDELGVGHGGARCRDMLPPRLEAVEKRLRLLEFAHVRVASDNETCAVVLSCWHDARHDMQCPSAIGC